MRVGQALHQIDHHPRPNKSRLSHSHLIIHVPVLYQDNYGDEPAEDQSMLRDMGLALVDMITVSVTHNLRGISPCSGTWALHWST